MWFEVSRMLGFGGQKVVTWVGRDIPLRKITPPFSQVTRLQGYTSSLFLAKLRGYKVTIIKIFYYLIK